MKVSIFIIIWCFPGWDFPTLPQEDHSVTAQCPDACRTRLGIQISRESSLGSVSFHVLFSATCCGWDIRALRFGIIFTAGKNTPNYLVQFTLWGRVRRCDKIHDQVGFLFHGGGGRGWGGSRIFLSQNHYLLPTYLVHSNLLIPAMLVCRFLVSGCHHRSSRSRPRQLDNMGMPGSASQVTRAAQPSMVVGSSG